MGGVLLRQPEAVDTLHTSQTGPVKHKVRKLEAYQKMQYHLHTYREMLQFAQENDYVAQEIAERYNYDSVCIILQS